MTSVIDYGHYYILIMKKNQEGDKYVKKGKGYSYQK